MKIVNQKTVMLLSGAAIVTAVVGCGGDNYSPANDTNVTSLLYTEADYLAGKTDALRYGNILSLNLESPQSTALRSSDTGSTGEDSVKIILDQDVKVDPCFIVEGKDHTLALYKGSEQLFTMVSQDKTYDCKNDAIDAVSLEAGEYTLKLASDATANSDDVLKLYFSYSTSNNQYSFYPEGTVALVVKADDKENNFILPNDKFIKKGSLTVNLTRITIGGFSGEVDGRNYIPTTDTQSMIEPVQGPRLWILVGYIGDPYNTTTQWYENGTQINNFTWHSERSEPLTDDRGLVLGWVEQYSMEPNDIPVKGAGNPGLYVNKTLGVNMSGWVTGYASNVVYIPQ